MKQTTKQLIALVGIAAGIITIAFASGAMVAPASASTQYSIEIAAGSNVATLKIGPISSGETIPATVKGKVKSTSDPTGITVTISMNGFGFGEVKVTLSTDSDEAALRLKAKNGDTVSFSPYLYGAYQAAVSKTFSGTPSSPPPPSKPTPPPSVLGYEPWLVLLTAGTTLGAVGARKFRHKIAISSA